MARFQDNALKKTKKRQLPNKGKDVTHGSFHTKFVVTRKANI